MFPYSRFTIRILAWDSWMHRGKQQIGKCWVSPALLVLPWHLQPRKIFALISNTAPDFTGQDTLTFRFPALYQWHFRLHEFGTLSLVGLGGWGLGYHTRIADRLWLFYAHIPVHPDFQYSMSVFVDCVWWMVQCAFPWAMKEWRGSAGPRILSCTVYPRPFLIATVQ